MWAVGVLRYFAEGRVVRNSGTVRSYQILSSSAPPSRSGYVVASTHKTLSVVSVTSGESRESHYSQHVATGGTLENPPGIWALLHLGFLQGHKETSAECSVQSVLRKLLEESVVVRSWLPITFECHIGKQIYFKIFWLILILAFKFNELREERGTITEKWKSEEVTFLLLETRGTLPFVVHRLALCQELF